MRNLIIADQDLYSVGPENKKKPAKSFLGYFFIAAITIIALSSNGNAQTPYAKGRIPVTDESYFFLDNATLPEPYASLDQTLKPIQLSRLLDERNVFPEMHDILEGDKRVIGIRILAKGRGAGQRHSTWSENLTFLLPPSPKTAKSTERFEASRIIGIYSTSGKEARYSFMGFVASGGTLTVSSLDHERLRVSIDLTFKRIDVDASLYIEDDIDDREYLDEIRKEKALFSLIKYRKTFLVQRKGYKDLSTWEGRPIAEGGERACDRCD